MILAVQNYQFFKGRDDLALRHVAELLPNALKLVVKEERINGHAEEDFNAKYDQITKLEHSQKANDLLSNLKMALEINDPEFALQKLIQRFGQRIPKDTSLIVVDSQPKPQYPDAAFESSPIHSQSPAILSVTSGG